MFSDQEIGARLIARGLYGPFTRELFGDCMYTEVCRFVGAWTRFTGTWRRSREDEMALLDGARVILKELTPFGADTTLLQLLAEADLTDVIAERKRLAFRVIQGGPDA